VKVPRLAALLATLACLAAGALAPVVACNGTGTTPMCDFPDGANNPESGCGVLIEASAADAMTGDVVEEPTPGTGAIDASDAAAPLDATNPEVSDTGTDAGDSQVLDATGDSPG
jgi:hypothetical protein